MSILDRGRIILTASVSGSLLLSKGSLVRIAVVWPCPLRRQQWTQSLNDPSAAADRSPRWELRALKAFYQGSLCSRGFL